jgi:hypothetical protein
MTGFDLIALIPAGATADALPPRRSRTAVEARRTSLSFPKEASMTSLSRSLLAALLCTAAVVTATPGQAEDAVLVSSTVEGYVPGSVITDSQTLALAPGASATLLFRSGGIVQVKGPFKGRLDALRPAGAPGGAEGLVQALRGQGVEASVIGATRGFTTPSAHSAMTGAPVNVDVRNSAIYCVGPNDTLWLRGAAVTSGIIRLRHGRSLREVAWPEGAGRIAWPADVPVEDGDRFDVVDNAGAVTVTMIFHRFDPPSSSTAWIAAGLLSGCRSQVEPALRELALEIEKTAGN